MTSGRKLRTRALVLAALLNLSAAGFAQAQLPPEVEADRLLLLARDSMEAGEWKKAREAFEGILALGISVPPDFHYHYARALNANGKPREARDTLSLYLRNADRGSETYRDALALFNEADTAAKGLDEKDKAAAAAVEKKKEEERKTAARVDEQAKALRDKIAEAKAGNADAQEALGTWYMYGRNGAKKDYTEARKWYELAAAQNHHDALSGLGYLYFNGWGVPKDFVKVREYYLRSAAGENSDALHGLGVIYYNGFGVKKDPVAAAKWFRRAADAGSALSQYNLATMYINGDGVPRNRDAAYELYLKAGKQGLKSAQDAVQSSFGGFHVWK